MTAVVADHIRVIVIAAFALAMLAGIAVVKLRGYRDTDRRDNRHHVMQHLARARNHRKGRG